MTPKAEPAPDDGARIEAELADLIAGAFGRHGMMAVKWVCLVEAIGAESEMALWTLTSSAVRAWDTKGMLGHAMDIQQAQTTAFVLGILGEGDDTADGG